MIKGRLLFATIVFVSVGGLLSASLYSNRPVIAPESQVATVEEQRVQLLTKQLLLKIKQKKLNELFRAASSTPATSTTLKKSQGAAAVDSTQAQAADDAEIVEIAQARKEAMLMLIEKDPQAFLDNALQNEIQNEIPKAAHTYIETLATIEGKVALLEIDDPQGGAAKEEYAVFAAAGSEKNKYNLHIANEGENDLQPGATIRVNGVLLDAEIVVETDKVVPAALVENSTTSVELLQAATPPAVSVPAQPEPAGQGTQVGTAATNENNPFGFGVDPGLWLPISKWGTCPQLMRQGHIFEIRNSEGQSMFSKCTLELPKTPFEWHSGPVRFRLVKEPTITKERPDDDFPAPLNP